MPQKILVLDDEENYAKMLHSLLEQHYFLVDSATRPEVALKAIEERGYELVISDYKMPVMDGADFLQQSRQIKHNLPVILVSGLMNTPELVKVANMGVTLVLEKPIDIDNFISHVRRFVQPLSEQDFHRHKNVLDLDAQETQRLESGGALRKYPAGSKFLADASLAMQRFLNELYQSLDEQVHLFLKTPAGSELLLLLREISGWQEAPTDNIHIIDVSLPPPDDVQSYWDELQADRSLSMVLGVTGYPASDLDRQGAWVDIFREAPEDFVFIHAIDELLFLRDPIPLQEELYELMEQSLSRFPTLSERRCDIAIYANRTCLAQKPNDFKPDEPCYTREAAIMMLTYDWPGNYRELTDTFRRARNLCAAGPFDASALQEIMQRNGGTDAHEPQLQSMQSYLVNEQKKLLTQAMRDSGDALPDILDRLRVDSALADMARNPNELSLLYPELLKMRD
ncbi:MAG: response regulator [Verrucomicrobiota bacterium]